MEKKENILGTEKISKLIRKFSIPTIISMLVNSLYNIVDQIFIGWGVGYLGNGATNIVFPLVMLSLAFGLMFGDGGSAYLSLKLGEKKNKQAAKGVGNTISISIIVSVIICVIALIFLPQLLNIFGCTDALRSYALDYGYIIVLGLPFMIVGVTLNSIIRADGSPKYAMKSMLTGAILNTILDPIFIFVLNMGVQGAAIATVISQIITFIINILYIRNFKNIKVGLEEYKIKANVLKNVLLLGISSFINQISIVLVISVENNLLAKYGAYSRFGAEIPITVLGIVMKISQILNSIIIGIAVGSQPIIGYNYGAGKYERVKETFKVVVRLCLIISTIAFVLFQTIPDKLITIFGTGDEKYMEFACMAFRTYLMLCITIGLQIPAGIFFQAIGKSSKSAIISLSRQILFLIPAMAILGATSGIDGILYSGPIADGAAFILALFFIIREMKQLDSKQNGETNFEQKENELTLTKNNFVITIAREYGSGGRYIGELVAKKLGVKLYDKGFISKVSEKTGLSEQYIEQNEQKRTSLSNLNNGYYYMGLDNSDELFVKESEIIKDIAGKESCVIVGRCANFILKDNENVFSVFITSSMEDKIERVTKYYGVEKDKAEKEIKRINKMRANHYKHYTEQEWNNPENYDLCINCKEYGIDGAADLICTRIKEKIKS